MSTTLPVLYFGKLPSRGDFVRSSSHQALIQSLDQWLSGAIELMAEDAHWKQIYDKADAAHFALLSPSRHTALVGHLVPSADTSGRRFPFVAACAIESEDGLTFMSLAPLILQPIWNQLADACNIAQAARDEHEGSVLSDLTQLELSALQPAVSVRQRYHQYIEQTTLGSFARDLAGSAADIDLRQTVLALGLLLQPVMSSPGTRIEKGLFLPLPSDDLSQALAATFWMDLVLRFLGRTAHDLTVFLPRGNNHPPGLMIGFSAGAAAVLHGLLDIRITSNVFLSLGDSPWVEAYVAEDYGMKKLSSYLQQPSMSLAQVLKTFQESFLGM